MVNWIHLTKFDTIEGEARVRDGRARNNKLGTLAKEKSPFSFVDCTSRHLIVETQRSSPDYGNLGCYRRVILFALKEKNST